MTDYKFVDVSTDVMDMLVDAEFESALPPFQNAHNVARNR